MVNSRNYKINSLYTKEYLELIKFYNPSKYEEIRQKIEEEKRKAKEVRKLIWEGKHTRKTPKKFGDEWKKIWFNAYYDVNKDKLRAYQREYNRKNKLKCSEYNKLYYQANKKRLRAMQRENYIKRKLKK